MTILVYFKIYGTLLAVYHNESLSNIEKKNYLKSYLGGNAYNTIPGFALSNQHYLEAI